MRKCLFCDILVVLVSVFSTAAKAVVVDITWHNFNPAATWSFDYDLQVLAAAETIYDMSNPLGMVYMGGKADPNSTFTIIRAITNETGISWTGYILDNIPSIFGAGEFVEGSAESTHLKTITYPEPGSGNHIEFSGPPPVLDGESFTIQFDFNVPGNFLTK